MSDISRIALLTSGGDAPGMNAAVRAVVRSADAKGIETIAVSNGYQGMIENNMRLMDAREVSGILHLGGTILGTARSDAFRTPEGRAKAADNLNAQGVDGIVIIGGDGSLTGGQKLAEEHNFHVIGIPGTIDNDLSGTDFTIGFDTAVNTAMEAIDKIRDTASSHHRTFFVEVMGRHAGWLALYAGISTGATAALIPEREDDIAHIRERIFESFKLNKRFSIIVVAEGENLGGAEAIAEMVKNGEGTENLDIRVANLGHMQRGGSPSMRDRVLGARLGDAAVQALVDGKTGVMVGERYHQIVHTPFTRLKTTERNADMFDLVEMMDRLAR
ncbi:6-phosphofructokinase [Stomatohabitans albus]|uniref:6-phosphofructokinase n=1 Tax=Stomatohabitans albus TaxID=3110766 RepID=UPI00300C1022